MRLGRKPTIYILIVTLCILCGLLYVLRGEELSEGFSESIPKIVWSYWNDPEIPPKIKKILDDREEILSTWEHRVLNEETVYNYIPRDSFPEGYDSLSQAAKSDWIRLYLLKWYGGCWMDASIIINTDVGVESMFKGSMQAASELTGFYLSSHTMNSVKETYIESWFIMAPAGSRLISLWYEEFTEAVTGGFLPYKKKVFSKIDVSNIYPRSDENTYLTIHASLQYVLQVRMSSKPKILIFDAADTMFKPHIDCKWDTECTIRFIRETPKEKQPTFIKLRSNERIEL